MCGGGREKKKRLSLHSISTMTRHRAGLHINPNTLQEYHDETDARVCQIFVVVPRSTQFMKIDAVMFARACKSIDMRVVVHSSYVINPWNKTVKYHYPLAVKQLECAAAMGARQLVHHIPVGDPRALVPVYKKLLAVKPASIDIVLENRAQIPDAFSLETPAKLNAFIDTFIRAGVRKLDIHICIDTAHLFSCGTELRTYEQAREWFAALRYPDRIALFHLNGSESTTHADKHALPFGDRDRIWGSAHARGRIPYDKSGYRYVVEFARAHKLDIILEIEYQPHERALRALIKRVQI